jgi:glycosyltransferase involved in cell wall biosynthesis
MKKLLIVTDAWRPQVNGVVRVIEEQTPFLVRQGWEVVLIEPGQFMSIPMPLYPEIMLALFPRRRVSKLIKHLNPDAIHLATEGPLGFAARRVCMREGIPFTTWYHTHFQLYVDVRIPGLMPLIWWFLRRFHSGAARTFVSTKSLQKQLERRGFKNLCVVPLGVDTNRFIKSKTPTTLPKPVFMYLGRLAPEKNPEEFLQLNLPGTKLVVGDGPDRARLEKKYRNSALFVGYKQGKELVDWLSQAEVLVFPSRTETFGLVALEALSCGIPVAAHDVMGPRDIITHGVDGYLSEDLSDAAQKCLGLDPNNCRKKAELFSWQHSAEEFIKNVAVIEK